MTPGAAYRLTPIAREAGATNQAAWSPDGRSIAFAMFVKGHFQIFVRALDSDSPAQLTHGSRDAEWPFWWPDGNRVGFVSHGEVRSVSRAGGEPDIVHKESVSAATLSPDGRTLATWRRDESMNVSGVWLATPPGAAPRKYAPAPFADTTWSVPVYLHFSPDGSRLLLADWTDAGDSAIWVLPFPDGGQLPHRLVPRISNNLHDRPPTQFAWMPDNEHAVMVFRAASTPQGGLWLTDVQSGAATPRGTSTSRTRTASRSCGFTVRPRTGIVSSSQLTR